MKRIFQALALWLCCCTSLYAQKENNIWAFDDSIGIDFNSGTPLPITTAAHTLEGCATVCDSRGNLLFYSDQQQVWDRNHHVMPNGSGFSFYKSATQGVVFAPFIHDTNRYYLFTLVDVATGTKPIYYLSYSVIDKRLNSGLGDIVAGMKNILLDSSMSEKMILAQSDNCNSLWLLASSCRKEEIYAYKITAAGIASKPVVSALCPLPDTHDYWFACAMQLSTDFSTLAISQLAGRPSLYSQFSLLDFDKSTGRFSNCRILEDFPGSNGYYDMAFSPGNSKLYASTAASEGIFQYDLSLLPDLSAVRSSRTKVKAKEGLGMSLGPDGKIYIKNYKRVISRINAPELAGAACMMEDDIGISFPPKTSVSGSYMMQNPIVFPKKDTVQSPVLDTLVCLNTPVTIKGLLFDKPGTQWQYRAADACTIMIDTITVRAMPQDTVIFSRDTGFCFTDKADLNAAGGYDRFLWNDGSTTRTNTVHSPGVYWVFASNEGCRTRLDTFRVTHITDFESPLPVSDSLCGDSLLLDAGVTGATYIWQDGSFAAQYRATRAGLYWVMISRHGCTLLDSVLVADKSFEVNLGGDQFLCEDQPLVLDAGHPGAGYLWQDGSGQQQFTVSRSGSYSVTVSAGHCKASDTVQVSFLPCEHCIAVPNAFSPNGDQHNDLFRPLISCPSQSYQLKIFNRYGQLIYSSPDPSAGWDGRMNGSALNPGVYFYMIKVRFSYTGATEMLLKGDISLLR